MHDLARYAQFFDLSYPEYSDVRYAEICTLVAGYDDDEFFTQLGSQQFLEWTQLIRPLIKIKNYKSQVPFPEEIQAALVLFARIRRGRVGHPNVFEDHAGHLRCLVAIQGFQLPTASAVFHFCHPDSFPIVDINVQKACGLLGQRFPGDFRGIVTPRLPATNTSPANKLEKYKLFVAFIDRVKHLQAGYGGNPTYRDLDKALMVLGNERLRSQVEETIER